MLLRRLCGMVLNFEFTTWPCYGRSGVSTRGSLSGTHKGYWDFVPQYRFCCNCRYNLATTANFDFPEIFLRRSWVLLLLLLRSEVWGDLGRLPTVTNIRM